MDEADTASRMRCSRRTFLGHALTAGGSLLTYRTFAEAVRSSREPAVARAAAPLQWIRIAPDGAISAYTRATELGQGASTTVALIVAEELDIEPMRVRVDMAPVQEAYFERDNVLGYGGNGYYATWGSLSSRDMDKSLRYLAAATRALLLEAAARTLGVTMADCRLENGMILTGGRALSYGSLAALAASLPLPAQAEPKPRSVWRRLGKPTARIDAASKVDGALTYGIDVQMPRLKIASVRQCPTFGGRLAALDSAPARAVEGVERVLALEDAVVVIARDFWTAERALDRLQPLWKPDPSRPVDSAACRAALMQGLASGGRLFLPTADAGASERVRGAHAAGLARATHRLQALYEVPFLAHAPLEPMNATARVTADHAELWVPTQYQSMVREVVAERLNLSPQRVVVHTTAVGGGFGRRTEIDYALQAVEIARRVDHPVKLVWSRAEDTSRGFFRPAALLEVRAGLDAAGEPTALGVTVACPSIMDHSIERRHGAPQPEIDEAGLATARDLPYDIPAQQASLASVDLGVPVTWMRSVGAAASVFALESFLDEMAAVADQDPLAYRRRLLRERTRELRVLDALAQQSGYQAREGARTGRASGIALSCTNGSVVGQIVDIAVTADREIRLERICCVVDCGVAFNPDAVIAQMEGGIIFGLTSALFGEITLEGGAVRQKNFDSYPLLRLNQTPPIEVRIVESDAPIGGVGEEAVPPVGAALANAIHAATGVRLRSMPLLRQGFKLAS